MKFLVPEDLTPDDVPAIALGLYHTAKSFSAGDREPKNIVEYTLNTRANEVFEQYLAGMRDSFMALMEKSR